MENKRMALLALVVATALVVTAGEAYATNRPETDQSSSFGAGYGPMGPWMMGGAGSVQQGMNQCVHQGYQMGGYQYMWNCSQQGDSQSLHQDANNYTNMYEYLWNHCNSTGGT